MPSVRSLPNEHLTRREGQPRSQPGDGRFRIGRLHTFPMSFVQVSGLDGVYDPTESTPVTARTAIV